MSIPTRAMGARLFLVIISVLLAVSPLTAAAASATAAPAAAASSISNVQVLTPSLAVFEKFEVQFDLATTAANPDLPYDAEPPAGLAPGIGISVDALFSHDGWQTSLTQPAFFYQPYNHTVVNGQDHFTPSGPPRWAVRFAPQQAGAWQFRLRVQDASGVSYYPSPAGGAPFNVQGQSSNAYLRRGFVRVSAADPRYFEFEDGTPFVGVGFNDGFADTTSVSQKMQAYEQNKMNFMRVWLSGAGINGSQWSSWGYYDEPNDSYLPAVSFDTHNTFNGADVSLRLDSSVPCLFADHWQGSVPVEPNTTYNLSARVRLANVTGPAGPGAYGFVVKTAGWLGSQAVCTQDNGPAVETAVTAPLAGTTGWTTVSGSLKTGPNQSFLGNLHLARQNATGGTIYVDEVRLWRAGDPSQVNLLRAPGADRIMYFDGLNAALWDQYIDLAQQHGVYLKLVVDEKNEWIRDHLTAAGAMSDTGSNDNFYAAPNTKVRWLEQAWWRYLIARWGYSPAIHSFEYINEGDPYNGNHYSAAEAMARYFRANDPAHHMVTTSMWAAFPNQEFWSSPSAPDVDYADLHAYISTGWGTTASFLPPPMVETRAADVHSGNASARVDGTSNTSTTIVPRGIVLRQPGEWIVRYWMKADSFQASCGFGGSGGMQRVRWLLDGGKYWGGSEGVVPFNATGQDFLCTSPGGSFGWQQFSSDRDRAGQLIPQQYRLVVSDSQPHELLLSIENTNGTGGTAWIDDVQLVSPSGQVVPVIGQFDVTPMDEDTAWFNAAYGELFGGKSPVGAHKPLVRGETGVDAPGNQNWNPELLKDTAAIWLHNAVWGQINPGGMYDLMWWAAQTIGPAAYTNYLTYRNFMEGIPLNNGHYVDAGAQSSNPSLRVWGQRDDANGRVHLWAQNTQHTWKRVVYGPAIPAISGTITLYSLPPGTYRVTWWNTYRATSPIFLTQMLTTSGAGSLTLSLPAPLSDDVGIKLEKQFVPSHWAFLPLIGH
jgi:hypothetical protein